MNDVGNYEFFYQIDQLSAEIWKKHSWLKDLEFGIDRDFFNIKEFYCKWLEFILPNMEISIGPWSKHAEFKSLFQLIHNLNPYYFRSDEIRQVIDKFSILRHDQKEKLTFKITGFFR